MRAIDLILFATIALAQAQDLAPPPIKVVPPSPTPTAGAAGNLPPDFYPASPCIKPPVVGDRPRDARDGKAVDDYNKRVQAYNQVAKTFNACVTDYAARAQVDLARIQAAVRDANTH